LQYLWNMRTLLNDPVPPRSLVEALGLFWFDVTKVDWRDTMVGQVPGVMASQRLRMYVFDLHQQFGWPALALAGLGVSQLARAGRRAVLLLLLMIFGATLLFGLTYSVGDTHVFLLPS